MVVDLANWLQRLCWPGSWWWIWIWRHRGCWIIPLLLLVYPLLLLVGYQLATMPLLLCSWWAPWVLDKPLAATMPPPYPYSSSPPRGKRTENWVNSRYNSTIHNYLPTQHVHIWGLANSEQPNEKRFVVTIRRPLWRSPVVVSAPVTPLNCSAILIPLYSLVTTYISDFMFTPLCLGISVSRFGSSCSPWLEPAGFLSILPFGTILFFGSSLKNV